MISYKQLGVLLMAFVLGIISFLIFNNILDKEQISVSTIELIGFISSLVLSTASVVLAITAINLGKSSEKIMVERNDKSIDQQTEIFTKTIEVLQRIESSTGVTEKRIEDIISGRVGQIADKLSSKNIRDRDKIEAEIKKSLTEKLTPKEEAMRQKAKKEKEAARERYDKYHEDLLLVLSNSNKIKATKLGKHGSYSGEGEELFDGIFEVNGKKVGISVFSKEELIKDSFLNGFSEFVTQVTQEIDKGLVEYFFFLSDEESKTSIKLKNQLEESTKLFKQELKERIYILTGTDSELTENILEKIKSTKPKNA